MERFREQFWIIHLSRWGEICLCYFEIPIHSRHPTPIRNADILFRTIQCKYAIARCDSIIFCSWRVRIFPAAFMHVRWVQWLDTEVGSHRLETKAICDYRGRQALHSPDVISNWLNFAAKFETKNKRNALPSSKYRCNLNFTVCFCAIAETSLFLFHFLRVGMSNIRYKHINSCNTWEESQVVSVMQTYDVDRH